MMTSDSCGSCEGQRRVCDEYRSRRPLVITPDQDRVRRDRIWSLLTIKSQRLRSLCLTRAWGFESPLPHH